jgi:hypothetical protein
LFYVGFKGDLYGGINEFKKGYQPRSNLVKDENGDLFAYSNTNSSPSIIIIIKSWRMRWAGHVA